MAGRCQTQKQKTKEKERFSYTGPRHNWSGPTECSGYWTNERDVLSAFLPVLTELIQKNLRDHLKAASTANPLRQELEGGIKAELAKVDQGMKNLLEAVKQGALSLEQVKEENAELQEAKRRLEKRLNDLKDLTRVGKEISAVLESFDQDLDAVLNRMMQNRLRFNTFVRIFFAELVVQVDRPGMNWRKGKKKGELPLSNPRIVKFALDPGFEDYLEKSGIDLPEPLKKAER